MTKLVRIILYVWDKRLVGKGWSLFLAHLWDADLGSPFIESIFVVSKFQDVFDLNLPSMLQIGISIYTLA